MTSLIRASSDSGKDGLSEAEIFGNIFVFNFAGQDTTSHTLAYALVLLAGHPEVQDWISEEKRHVSPKSDCGDWEYEKTYPRLKRCLAVLVSRESLLCS